MSSVPCGMGKREEDISYLNLRCIEYASSHVEGQGTSESSFLEGSSVRTSPGWGGSCTEPLASCTIRVMEARIFKVLLATAITATMGMGSTHDIDRHFDRAARAWAKAERRAEQTRQNAQRKAAREWRTADHKRLQAERKADREWRKTRRQEQQAWDKAERDQRKADRNAQRA